jgi:hypothetical protein
MRKNAFRIVVLFSLLSVLGCKGPNAGTGTGTAALGELHILADGYPISTDEEFSADRTTYTVSVANDVENYFVYGIPVESGASIEYDPGQSVVSPPVGNTIVSLTVTSGINSDVTNEYTVTLCRDGSNNADFANLTVGGEVPTGFSPGGGQESGDLPLTVDVGSTVESVVITGTAVHPNATVSYSPEPTNGSSFAISPGENPFTVVITAEDGVTQAYYNFVIYRPTGQLLFDAIDAESNISSEPYQFDQLSINDGNDLAVIGTNALAGNYSYRLNYGGVPGNRSVRCVKLLEPNPENPNLAEISLGSYAVVSGGAYAKALVDIGGMASMNTSSTNQDFDIFMMNDDSLMTNSGIRVVVADGAIRGFKAVTDTSTTGTTINLGSLDLTELVSGPFWIELGFMIGTEGGAEIRINGQSVYSENRDTSGYNIFDLLAGNRTGVPDSPGSMVIDSIEMQTGDWLGVEPG